MHAVAMNPEQFLRDLLYAVFILAAFSIGVDILLDRYTEPKKDRKLKDVIETTTSHLVLGGIEKPVAGSPSIEAHPSERRNQKSSSTCEDSSSEPETDQTPLPEDA